MNSGLLEGLVAGFGIAIPFGPISVLIIRTSMENNLKLGLAAGFGAASADFIFAAVSALAGALIAGIIAPIGNAVRLISAGFLLFLGIWGIRKVWRPISPEGRQTPALSSLGRTYFTILTLTLLNPITVAYFTALILRKGTAASNTPGELILFVAGAGAASLAWQSFLAAIGHLLKKALSDKFRVFVSVLGNLVILGFGFSALVSIL